MLFKKNPILGCAIGLSMLCQTAMGAEVVTVMVGETECEERPQNLGGGIWGIEVYSDDEPITVVSSGSSIDIAYIDVISEGDGVVTLTVSGAIDDVYEIVSSGASAGEVWVTSVTAGAVGDITANIIGTVTASVGHIYGEIDQISSLLADSNDPGITLLKSENGSITGDI